MFYYYIFTPFQNPFSSAPAPAPAPRSTPVKKPAPTPAPAPEPILPPVRKDDSVEGVFGVVGENNVRVTSPDFSFAYDLRK